MRLKRTQASVMSVTLEVYKLREHIVKDDMSIWARRTQVVARLPGHKK